MLPGERIAMLPVVDSTPSPPLLMIAVKAKKQAVVESTNYWGEFNDAKLEKEFYHFYKPTHRGLTWFQLFLLISCLFWVWTVRLLDLPQGYAIYWALCAWGVACMLPFNLPALRGTLVGRWLFNNYEGLFVVALTSGVFASSETLCGIYAGQNLARMNSVLIAGIDTETTEQAQFLQSHQLATPMWLLYMLYMCCLFVAIYITFGSHLRLKKIVICLVAEEVILIAFTARMLEFYDSKTAAVISCLHLLIICLLFIGMCTFQRDNLQNIRALFMHGKELELELQLEEQRALTKVAEAKLQAEHNMIGFLAHEIRNPLAAVLGWTEQIQLFI
jgi:signal transduction histidine kinase